MSQILLVRHGQASFGAVDYDNLSELGDEQARVLGVALARRGVRPDLMVCGQMKRHTQTAEAFRKGGGWDLPLEIDPGWNEFDHLQVLTVHAPPESTEAESEQQAFQRWFAGATKRWTAGSDDAAYDEPFSAFAQRVEGALSRLAAQLGPGQTAVVMTSGGPVSWASAHLLGADTDTWLRLNPVCVNTAVTKLVVGSRGVTLVSFNDHSHLNPDLLTYR